MKELKIETKQLKISVRIISRMPILLFLTNYIKDYSFQDIIVPAEKKMAEVCLKKYFTISLSNPTTFRADLLFQWNHLILHLKLHFQALGCGGLQSSLSGSVLAISCTLSSTLGGPDSVYARFDIVSDTCHPAPCYLNNYQVSLLLSDRYCNPKQGFKPGSLSECLLEFDTCLKPLDHHSRCAYLF